jgi:hypothetical protein
MGSGISLGEIQISEIIKRDLVNKFNKDQTMLPLYTDDGYEIYRDFSEEVELNNTIKEINLYTNHKIRDNKKNYNK